jgi:hypothetical protein
MGLAVEVLAGRVTNPGAALTALTADSGDSFSVRAMAAGSNAWLDDVWAHEATPGVVRVRSPRFHDNVQGVRLTNPTVSARPLLPDELNQPLYSQDVLTVELSGGGAETDVACLVMYYENVAGLDARLSTWPQVYPRIRNILTQEVAIAGAGTLGDWSAGTAINTTFDLLKANVDYAVLGYVCGSAVAAVALRGPDTGNVKIGGPGTTEAIETRNWFIRQSNILGKPWIPIINAANKGATLAFQVSASAAATTTVDWILAELAPTSGM